MANSKKRQKRAKKIQLVWAPKTVKKMSKKFEDLITVQKSPTDAVVGRRGKEVNLALQPV